MKQRIVSYEAQVFLGYSASMNTAQAEPHKDPPWAEEADDAVQQINFIPLLYHHS